MKTTPGRFKVERYPASQADRRRLADHWDRIADRDGSTFAFVPSGTHPDGALLVRLLDEAALIQQGEGEGEVTQRAMDVARALRSELTWQSNDSVKPLAAALQRMYDEGLQDGKGQRAMLQPR